MMTVASLASGQASYYLSLATTATDYYIDTKGIEPAGVWYAAGAAEFNLSGRVEADALNKLCEGFDPHDDSKHVRNAGKDTRQHGTDCCFSAPKSVSAAWALATPEMRKDIEAAMHASVRDALDYIQDKCGYARVGAQGQTLKQVPLTFALFEHSSSRAGDAQLHVHCVMPNITKHADNGRVTAVDSTFIYHHMMSGGAIFRASFAEDLRRMGFTIERDNSCFRIKDFSQELCDEISTRRAEILEGIYERCKTLARMEGLSEAEIVKKASGRMAEIVNLETRRSKKEASREDVFEATRKVAQSMGIGENYVEQFITHQRKFTHEEKTAIKEAVFQKSIATLTDTYAHWNERDLTRILAEESQGKGLNARDVRELVAEKLLSHELVRIGEIVTSHKHESQTSWMERTEQRFTTPETLELEARLLADVQKLMLKPAAVERSTALGVIEITREQLAKEDKKLSPEQAKAIEELTTRDGGISCLTGVAGSSKSTILGACRLAWELSGKNVIGCALGGVAQESLKQSSGIESDTLAMTLTRLRHGRMTLKHNDIVVLDEAGMVPTKVMAELTGHLTRSGASLVLAGDKSQIQSMGAGGPFASITERIENVSTLTEIHRQREEWRKETVHQLSRGEAHKALIAYAEHDQLHVTETREAALEKLVDLWKTDNGHLKEHTNNVFILAPMNCEVGAINKMCQEERLRAGELGEQSFKVAEGRIHVGDRIVLNKRDTRLKVENGNFAEVESIDEESENFTVRLYKDNRKVVISPAQYGNKFKLGYSSTVHTSQGSTRETVHVLLGGFMMDKHLSYVAASRSRGETHLVCDFEGVQKDPTLKTAMKSLAQAMSRDRTKNLAMDLVEKHQINQPVQKYSYSHSHSL